MRCVVISHIVSFQTFQFDLNVQLTPELLKEADKGLAEVSRHAEAIEVNHSTAWVALHGSHCMCRAYDMFNVQDKSHEGIPHDKLPHGFLQKQRRLALMSSPKKGSLYHKDCCSPSHKKAGGPGSSKDWS